MLRLISSQNRQGKTYLGEPELRWAAGLEQGRTASGVAERNRPGEQDGRRFEVQSPRFWELQTPNLELRIVPVSYVARLTRHGLWRCAACLKPLLGDSDSAHLRYVQKGSSRSPPEKVEITGSKGPCSLQGRFAYH